jgi:hypothetical protein
MFKPTPLDHERIEVIGRSMLAAPAGFTAACCVDADDGDKYQGKGEWYEQQFRKKFPALIIVKRFAGPTPGVHTIKLEAPPIRRRTSDN